MNKQRQYAQTMNITWQHKWITDMHYNMDETLKQYAKWKEANHTKPNIVWFHLYDMHRIGKSRETVTR